MVHWPQIDPQRCTGCGWCVAACPPHVLSLQPQGLHKRAHLHAPTGCTGCRLCERRCPFDAIAMAPPQVLGLTAPPADRS